MEGSASGSVPLELYLWSERERERGRVERKQYSLLAILGDGRVELLGFVFYSGTDTAAGRGVLCGGLEEGS